MSMTRAAEQSIQAVSPESTGLGLSSVQERVPLPVSTHVKVCWARAPPAKRERRAREERVMGREGWWWWDGWCDSNGGEEEAREEGGRRGKCGKRWRAGGLVFMEMQS